MTTRENFTKSQRETALRNNAQWLRDHKVDGVELALGFMALRQSARVYYCENCMFCHSDKKFFDVDHLVPDRYFRIFQIHVEARNPLNMLVLCKSSVKGDYGCNQSKGGKLHVPAKRGLALTHSYEDMNVIPIQDRPFSFTVGR